MSKIRSILFKNWIPKLTCLAIAIGLWFWVSIQQTGEVQFEVPVEFTNVPPNLVVADQNPRNVTVTLQGPKKTLFSTDSSNIYARVDLSGYESGTKVFWSSEINLESPKNLRVYSVTPRKIEVRLTRRSEKTLPVQPTVQAGPPEGMEYKISVKPETATVYGPSDTIRDMESLSLKAINLSEKSPDTYSYDREARPPREVELSFPTGNSFRVQAYVYEKRIRRTIKNIPVQVTDVPAGMKAVVEPSSIDLQVQGPQRQVKNLTAEDIEVKVKAPNKQAGQSIRVAGAAEISLPENIKRVNEDGEITALRVQLEPL